ncbi:MAG: 3D domain-containing protein [Verrucomicrobiota bacterium]
MKTILPVSFLSLALTLTMLSSTYAEKAKARFSLYYVAEANEVSEGGRTGKVETVEGKWETYRISRKDNSKANREGTVVTKDAEGNDVVVSISKIGVWHDLKKGWEGKGNRKNPLTSYRTIAADTKYHRYGSRIFVPGMVGNKMPNGKELDGYFWVGDVGGGINGELRFDIFVGRAD